MLTSRLISSVITSLVLTAVVACGGGGGSSTPSSPVSPPSTPTPPPTPPPVQPVPTSILITPATLTMTSLGQTAQLTATVNDQNGSPITGASVAWSSGNTGVATVSIGGLVTAVSNGTARITARSGSVSNGITVTVTAPVPNRAPEPVGEIEPQSLAENGPPAKLDVSAAFRDPDGDELTYSAESSDDQVATADASGTTVTIRPVAAGETTVTVTATDPDSLSATQTVSVTVTAVTGMNTRPEAVGMIADLRLVEGGPAEELDVSDAFRDAEGDSLAYTAVSSDELVATVDAMEALITIRPGSPGKTTISVRATDPEGLSATHSFAVTTVVSSPDRNALIAFYGMTGGPDWTDRANWLSNAPLDAWHGVATDADGMVTRLELNANNLRGTLPVELGRLGSITVLDLGGNHLSGGIPPEVGLLTLLEALNLEENQLTGTLPPDIEHLRNLETLHLAGNQLSGEIPAELEHLEALEVLDLGDNVFSSLIPPEIGTLQALVHLDLSANRFTGPLPSEIGRLGNLTTLNVASNPELAGPLPLSLSSLDLESLHINGTQLCAPLSEEFLEWLSNIADLSEIEGCPDE